MEFEKLFKRVELIALENPGGFTLELKTGELIASGIVSAYFETQNCFGSEGLKKCLRHALENDGYLGGWRNPEGLMQYDSCKIFRDLEKAISFGRDQKQFSIFDLNRGLEIKL